MLGEPGGGEAATGPWAWMRTQGLNGAPAVVCHLELETGLETSLVNVCRESLETFERLDHIHIKLKVFRGCDYAQISTSVL